MDKRNRWHVHKTLRPRTATNAQPGRHEPACAPAHLPSPPEEIRRTHTRRWRKARQDRPSQAGEIRPSFHLHFHRRAKRVGHPNLRDRKVNGIGGVLRLGIAVHKHHGLIAGRVAIRVEQRMGDRKRAVSAVLHRGLHAVGRIVVRHTVGRPVHLAQHVAVHAGAVIGDRPHAHRAIRRIDALRDDPLHSVNGLDQLKTELAFSQVAPAQRLGDGNGVAHR